MRSHAASQTQGKYPNVHLVSGATSYLWKKDQLICLTNGAVLKWRKQKEKVAAQRVERHVIPLFFYFFFGFRTPMRLRRPPRDGDMTEFIKNIEINFNDTSATDA